jgi:radical SAM/Cys-rich protein
MAIKQGTKSLTASASELNDTLIQLEVLNGQRDVKSFPSFYEKAGSLSPTGIDVLQINIGKLCNQTCLHCHVDAGPDKKRENMDKATLEKCLHIIKNHNIKTVDITGGAPEMNPHFRWFVEESHSAGVKIMNRCNLTIIESNPKYADLPEFFAKNDVQVISSLPYFTKLRTDSQRGDGVFEDSIKALKKLNAVGYGVDGSGLTLDLVYNPSGAFLPGDQSSLEAEFKRQMKTRYDIHFNQLFVITNLPISRFLDYLIQSGNYENYMEELVTAYNPATLSGLMCRYTLSVSWDGYLYDCDFNQMLDLKIKGPANHIDNFDYDTLMDRNIIVNQHCYGCTAGAGSSCGGAIA